MGCPAREVTGKQAGSALMRDLDHAERLIEAVRRRGQRARDAEDAARLGPASRNAPELARSGRGRSAWRLSPCTRARAASSSRVRPIGRWCDRVKAAVKVPVVINGDIVDPVSAKVALAQSGADAVMIGRGACGAPWLPARIAARACDRRAIREPRRLPSRAKSPSAHVAGDAQRTTGSASGCATRASTSAGIWPTSGRAPEVVQTWRRRLCTREDAASVLGGICRLLRQAQEMAA